MSQYYVIPDVLDRYVRAVAKGKVTHHDALPWKGERQEDTFHASDTLGCHRTRLLKRIKAPKTENDPVSMRRFILGDMVESIVQQALVYCIDHEEPYRGFKCEYHRHVSVPEWELTGTLDFLMTFPDGTVVLIDTKSCLQMKIDYVKKGEKDRKHYGQLSVYGMALAAEKQKVDIKMVVYIEKGTMATHPDVVPEGFEATVSEDYGILMKEWANYKKTRIMAPEMAFVPGKQGIRRDKSVYWKNDPNGGEMMPNVFTADPNTGVIGCCDPRYCQFLQHCGKVKGWWTQHGLAPKDEE